MKLLLTSNGLSNKSISNALFELVGKKPKDTKIVFIPTAMNVVNGEKNWFVNDLVNIQKTGAFLEIVDISALPKEIWLPKLQEVDVLFFSGGSSYHLMYWMEKSGLAELLPQLLKSRVYVGISAGSMVTSKDFLMSNKKKAEYHHKIFGTKSEKSLGFVDFYMRPHFNDSYFPHASEESIAKVANTITETIYAIDDETAIKIDGNSLEIISEGTWKKFN